MGVQGDGIWSGTNDDSESFVQVIYGLVALSRGNYLNQPEACNTVDERSGEFCQRMQGRKAVKNGGCDQRGDVAGDGLGRGGEG